VGLGFFAVPIPVDERWTVLFDVVVKSVTRSAPRLVGAYCLGLIAVGAFASLAAAARRRDRPRWLQGFRAAPAFTALRVVGLPLAVIMLFRIGPGWLLDEKIAGLMWSTLVFSVGVIIPVGAVALSILVSYGCLEFVGTLMRPIMRPLFRLPGRAALDDLTSWLGSYSVGLYLTRRLSDEGRYNRREAFIIVTAFSTVSIGFVGVVASTLDLLELFPLVFATYFVVVYVVAAILVRLWPTTSIPTTYVAEPDPEPEQSVTAAERWRLAWTEARRRAHDAPGPMRVAAVGFVDGLRLASTILGTILAVGTAAMLLLQHTSLFVDLGRPLAPVLSGLGLPDAELLAPASLAGITEMYIPALLVRDAAIEGRFFICVLSISQLVFFSSVAPMMMDMFRDVPIRFRHLVALFFIRTLILIPILAALCWLYGALGFF